MHTDRQKVALDYDILKWVNEYYSFSLKPENHVPKECFSAPDLNLHGCCVYAKLPGDKTCTCNHVPNRMCQITCYISEFCLAAYAYRLGIGGDNQNVAISENLKLGYKKLYNMVKDVLAEMGKGEESTRVMSSNEIDLKIPPQSVIDKMADEAEEKGEEEMPQKLVEEVVPLVEGVVVEEPTKEDELEETIEAQVDPKLDQEIDAKMEEKASETDPLLSVKEAAALWGCTYANISQKLKTGTLKVEMVGKKKMVRKSDVLRAKNKRSRKPAKKSKN